MSLVRAVLVRTNCSAKMRSKSIIFILINLGICTYGQKDLGSECIVEATKSSGTCKFLEKCPSVFDDVKRHVFLHTRCVPFAANGTEIVCCPELNSMRTTKPPDSSFSRKSERMCYGYKAASFEEEPLTKMQEDKCTNNPIPSISNSVTTRKEYPHMALIGYITKEGEILWLCGGALVSDEWVLAAAHCSNSEYGGPRRIRLGELHANVEDDSYKENYLVSYVYLHPEYDRSSAYNDIGMYKASPKVILSSLRRPACLPTGIFDSEGSKVIYTGWRQDNETGRVISHLRQSTVEIGSTKDCNDLYANRTDPQLLKQGIKPEAQVCVASTNSETDFKEFGGVLQVYHPERKCMFMVVGIGSFGILQPSENPEISDVYTRTFPLVDWLETNVWFHNP